MILNDEHIVLAVNHISSNKNINKESTNLVAARIIIKDIFE
jgi:hypothetical protein